jgi:hypothetical protein
MILPFIALPGLFLMGLALQPVKGETAVASSDFDLSKVAFTGKAVSVDFSSQPAHEDGLSFVQDSPETHCATATIDGSGCMQGSGFAYFRFTAPEFKDGGLPLVRVTFEYEDRGGGTVDIQYDSSDPNVHPGPQVGAWKGRHIAMLGNSGKWRSATYVIADGNFARRCNGSDFRLAFGSAPWAIRKVDVTAASTEDEKRDRQWLAGRKVWPGPVPAEFKLTRSQVLAKLGPYTGPTTLAAAPDTLVGKVECGYQGWFSAPGDGSGQGWVHYSEHGSFEPGDCHIEYWPDTRELEADEKYATPFRKADGSTAYVFSSYNRKTVIRHFKWMKEYGIDGAFVQRFVNSVRSPRDLNKVNAVLTHVREGANLYGRAYSVMYDLSGAGDCADVVIQDWKDLVDEMRLGRDPQDHAYQHINGKPLVTLWGLFADRADQHAAIGKIIHFLHDDPVYGGCAVMLGVNNDWRTNPSPNGQAVLRLCEQADIISPWMVGRFGTPDAAREFIAQMNVPDQRWCDHHGKEYLPVLFPGFSWSNMHDGLTPFNAIPRLKGRFFWAQAVAAKATGAKMFYIAMFDEMDEGTAILKCDPDPPAGQTHFLTFEGLPSDAYLWLTGEIGKLLRGEIPASPDPPTRHLPIAGQL